MKAIYYKLFPVWAVAAGFCSGCVTEQKETGTGMLENYVNRYIWPAESLQIRDYSASDDYLRIYIEGETVYVGPQFDEFASQYGAHRITAKAYRAKILSFMEQSLR